MSSFEESIAYARLTNVTKSVTNGRISVTFGSEVVFFALALKSCSTEDHLSQKALGQ